MTGRRFSKSGNGIIGSDDAATEVTGFGAATSTRSPAPGGSTMRVYHLTAIAIAFVAGFGVNQFFFAPSTAKANMDAGQGPIMDVAKLGVNTALPLQKMHDMSFVFSSND
jgi:hypothetical protein